MFHYIRHKCIPPPPPPPPPRHRIYASVIRLNVGSAYGLSPIRCQAISLANAELLLIGPPGTNSSEILIKMKK